MSSPESLAYVLLVVAVSGIIRVVCGFGNALIAMPLLALVLEMRVATPFVALVSLVFTLLILARTVRNIHPGPALRLVLWSLAGMPAGLFFLTGALDSVLRTGLGLIIAGYSAASLARPDLSGRLADDRSLPFFGIAAGVLGGAYNASGPPVVIFALLRGWDAPSFRATLQGYFLATGVMVSLFHGFSGLWTGEVLRLFAMSLPAAFLSVWIGDRLACRIQARTLEQAVHVLLIISGGLLVAKGLL